MQDFYLTSVILTVVSAMPDWNSKINHTNNKREIIGVKWENAISRYLSQNEKNET